MVKSLVRKPRLLPAPYKNKPKEKKAVVQDAPATSAKPPVVSRRDNLTLNDWLMVVEYYDTHLPISQAAVVNYFKNKQDGALHFTQSTLSRHLSKSGRNEDQLKLHSTSNALSSKRVRIVTRPDVELCLVLWTKHMEAKLEHVSGPMLAAKRRNFEDLLQVPDEERLRSEGWVRKFCKAYGLRNRRRHGEAGSVNLTLVETERDRVSLRLANYKPCDRLNFDETAWYPLAPPGDRGLAREQMSGKKSSKFRITLGFLVNADGSERYPIFFIGKAKCPRCFHNIPPGRRGFYYQNNKTAWMTSCLFEGYIKEMDAYFRKEGRNVCMTLDNFSGHTIKYTPTNIELLFFEPNLTPFVQPLDAGIIRCFKAHYRHAYCMRAIEKDANGEDNIWELNLLEAFEMAVEAWSAVSPRTIQNCWNHAGVQRDLEAIKARQSQSPGLADPRAWEIVEQFAQGDGEDALTLPAAEELLRVCLGDRFKWEEWKPAFDAVLMAEGDLLKAVKNIDELREKTLKQLSGAANVQPVPAKTGDLTEIEHELMQSISVLQKRNQIKGKAPSLEELVDPEEERKVGENEFEFPGGDKDIVARALETANERERDRGPGEGSDDELDDPSIDPTPQDVQKWIGMCQELEHASRQYPCIDGVKLSIFQGQLQNFQANLRKQQSAKLRQASIKEMFVGRTN